MEADQWDLMGDVARKAEFVGLVRENRRLRRGLNARLSDHINGTPCAEIRWQHEKEELEAEIDELVLEFNQCQKSIGRLTLELSKADCDLRKQAEWIAEARMLLTDEAGYGPREIDEWVRRRDALLEGSDG